MRISYGVFATFVVGMLILMCGSASAEWRPRDGNEPCASFLPQWKTGQCAYDSWGMQGWNWITVRSDRTDSKRIRVTYRDCSNRNRRSCTPPFGKTGKAQEIILVPRESVNLFCSNQGWIEVLLCEVHSRQSSSATPMVMRSFDCKDWNKLKESERFFARADGESIRRCLDGGANIEHRDELGRSPLHKAVLQSNANAVQALLDAGANVEARYMEVNHGTSLHLAARLNSKAVIRVLLEAGANLESVDEFGGTPLHWAAHAHRSGNINVLLAAGAKVDARDEYWGKSPLHDSVGNSHPIRVSGYSEEEKRSVSKTVSALIAGGANVEAQDNRGQTPLHHAATNNIYNDARAIEALVGGGAKVDARDVFGRTPLHKAAKFDVHKRRPVEICEIEESGFKTCSWKVRPRAAVHVRNATAAIHVLLNAGADALVQTNGGKTPLGLIVKDSPILGTEAYRRLQREAGGGLRTTAPLRRTEG